MMLKIGIIVPPANCKSVCRCVWMLAKYTNANTMAAGTDAQ